MRSGPPDAATLAAVAAGFAVEGRFLGASPHGSGHIHHTFRAVFDEGGTQSCLLLQRLNQVVFPDLDTLMANIAAVTARQRMRVSARGGTGLDRRVLRPIPTREGPFLLRDVAGGAWRAYAFIEGASGHEGVAEEAQAFQAAKAFGAFQRDLEDCAGVVVTIPGFHDTRARFRALAAALDSDPLDRAAKAGPEIRQALDGESFAGLLLDLQASGAIPERITHNDTKLNNVLLDDATGEGLCVVDLDTVMPGLSLYDFGDLARAACNPVAEDATVASAVDARGEVFEALVRGYLEGSGDLLLPIEKELLVASARLLAYELGLRFLTDHLRGDAYFRAARPSQNLDRARVQFALAKSFENQEEVLMRRVRSLL